MSKTGRAAGTGALGAGVLVTAALTTLVAAAPGAGAASASTRPYSYLGTAREAALTASLAGLPSSLPSPPIPGVDLSKGLTVGLVDSEGALRHDGSGSLADVATSVSQFGSGSLFTDALDKLMLNTQVRSDLAHPGMRTAPAFTPAQAQSSPLGGLSIPTLTATTITSPLATSAANSGVGLTAAKLSDLLPTGQLDALIAAAEAQLQTGSGTVQGAINTVLGQLHPPVRRPMPPPRPR